MLDWLTAIGTLGAVWAAIWGDRFRDFLFAPSLDVTLFSADGESTVVGNGAPVLLFHLRVRNLTPEHPAEETTASLVDVRRLVSGTFRSVGATAPRPMRWAPAEHNPLAITIHDEALLDFGALYQSMRPIDQQAGFAPWLPSYPNNFDGYVSAGETVRYVVQVRARRQRELLRVTVEVHWDGVWSADVNAMRSHHRVRVIATSLGTA